MRKIGAGRAERQKLTLYRRWRGQWSEGNDYANEEADYSGKVCAKTGR